MFWDKAAGLYDLFENIYNGKVNRQLCIEVADMMEDSDRVLECACGTGMITKCMAPKCKDEAFDKVVAGNVIHLLDEPYAALAELERVCKKGGKIIIPTYVNNENGGKPNMFVKILERFGAGFKCQFNYETYKDFFAKAGYSDVEYKLVQGKMPCAIAVIVK